MAEEQYLPAAVFLVGGLISLLASAKPGARVLVGAFVSGDLLIDDEASQPSSPEPAIADVTSVASPTGKNEERKRAEAEAELRARNDRIERKNRALARFRREWPAKHDDRPKNRLESSIRRLEVDPDERKKRHDALAALIQSVRQENEYQELTSGDAERRIGPEDLLEAELRAYDERRRDKDR